MYYNSNMGFLNVNKSLQSSEVLYTETNFSEKKMWAVNIYGMRLPALKELLIV